MQTRSFLVLGAAGLLTACGGGSQPAQQPEAPSSPAPVPVENVEVPVENVAAPVATEAASGAPAAFAQCAVCHSAAKDGKAMIGPDLWGVVGTKAASRPGFAYSAQLKAAGLTWDAATLDKWLTKPMGLVPGTKMTFAGLPDAAKRKEIIDFLETLK